MLDYKKKFRLISKEDFLSLRKGSLFLRSKSLIIYCKKNDLGFSRLGISSSKKFGNAVKRNNFKRITREVFRKHSVIQSSFDILVVSSTRFIAQKDKIQDIHRHQFNKDLSRLFTEISDKS